MSTQLKVAVVGASGIGLHHARWHHLSGSQVVAFAGTSDASCAATRARLHDYFGFEGRAYTDVSKMIADERPDIVDVSSPPHLHRLHAETALSAGCHVVCEKPLCWDANQTPDAIIADGEAVVAAAAKAGKHLVMSAQYPAVVPIYRDFYARVRGGWDRVASVSMNMSSRGRKGPKFGDEIWMDLASHPLSLLMGFLPCGEIDWATASCVIEARVCEAAFDWVSPEGRCAVRFTLSDSEADAPTRRFGVNDFMVDWDGYADADGVYRAKLTHGDEVVQCDDFMHILIAEFARHVSGEGGRVIVPGKAALGNLRHQVELLKRAERRE